MKLALLITAGGLSQRFGRNKLLEKVKEKEIILYTLEAFSSFDFVEIVITASQELKEKLDELLKNTNFDKAKVVLGGQTRQESVFNGLKALKPIFAKECEEQNLVVIHDGARPLVDFNTITNCIKKAEQTGAAIAAIPAIDTIKIVETPEESKQNKHTEGLIIETPERKKLWYVQTPQIFDYKTILEAHEQLQGHSFTDDACLLEALNKPVYTSMGSYKNIKITHRSDIDLVKQFLD